jgi:cytochrome c peroxidase
MRKLYILMLSAVCLALSACGGGGGSTSSNDTSSTTSVSTLSLAAQVGQKVFFDKNLSGNKNMACATCHDPAYAYGPPNSLSVQLGSDPSQSGTRAVPSLRYKSMTPTYDDNAQNPDGVSQNAPGGGFMWDGRATTLATQAALPLLNPVEMNNVSKTAVVQAVQNGTYAALFQQAFGANIFTDTSTAFTAIGQALQAFQSEDSSFRPFTSKYDLFLGNKIGGSLTAAEMRGLAVFNATANCAACHYSGANFDGTWGLMTDFTYQAIGVPRNDTSIPNNPSPIQANQSATYYDMGVCGPLRTDHTPATPNDSSDPYAQYCGLFKVPTLRNVATRNTFFHNGVFHSLTQVLNFYNTRDTHPEYWYPTTGGTVSGTNTNPSYALQPTMTGGTVQKFNDLPVAYQGNIDEEVPMGTGTAARNPGDAPVMTAQDITDLACFLNILTDGYQPPAAPPTSGTCVN